MTKKIILFVCAFTSGTASMAQASYYDVNPGTGYGVRFWQSDYYKIHMGNTSEYHFGPVTDYSIKTNMSGDPGRGYTWGISGATPVAALSNIGTMQLAGSLLTAGDVGIGTTSPSNIQGWARVLDVRGSVHSKLLASSSNANYITGMYSHTTWNGGGGFIGTETNHNLFLITNYSPKVVLTPGGYMGIGLSTLSPSSKLHVNSSIERESFRIYKDGNTTNYLSVWQGTGAAAIDPIGTGKLYLGYDQATDVYMGNDTGKVGIGTTTPGSYKLAVEGKIGAREVNVTTNAWSDYVFNADYKLRPLAEVQQYIEENHHLPEVPSEKEVLANGQNLGEMNAILLKKIEELTLYVIEQNRFLQVIQAMNEQQQREIETLKKN